MVYRLVYGVQASVWCTGWCMVVWGLGWGMVYRLVYGVQASVWCTGWCMVYRLVYGVYRYRCMVYWLVYGVQASVWCTG